MKKLLITFTCIMGLFAAQVANANPYKLDDTAVEKTFASASEITANEMALENLNLNTTASPSDDVTLGGFLVRNFFCGTFAVHRSYAGTKGLAFKYCITLGIVGTIDFWYTVFTGQEGLDNFTGNPNFVCWTAKGKQ